MEGVPVTGRQVDFPHRHALPRDRGDQQGRAEQEFVVAAERLGVLRKVEGQGAQDGPAAAVRLPHQGVEGRKQAVTPLQCRPDDRQPLRAEAPRFLHGDPAHRVVAQEGVKDRQLRPAGQQFTTTIPRETADVAAAQGHPRQAQAAQHGNTQGQMLPGAHVVARPGGGVTLLPGVPGAAHHEGPLVRMGRRQASLNGAVHAERVGVVDFQVALGAVLGVVGQGFALGDRPGAADLAGIGASLVHAEAGRFVHVRPDPAHARSGQVTHLLGPPRLHVRAREIREHRRVGPHLAHQHVPAPGAHQVVALQGFLVGGVPGLGLHARVHDGHDLNALLAHLLKKSCRVGKAGAVPGEHLVALHVIDVEVHRVERQAPAAKAVYHVAHVVGVLVAPARLGRPQRPQRRQGVASGQAGITFNHVRRCRPGDHVQIQFRPGALPGEPPRVPGRHVHFHAPRLVHEQAVRLAAVQHGGERNADVEGVALYAERKAVGVPEGEVPPAFVQRPDLLAEAQVSGVRRGVQVKGGAVQVGAALRGVVRVALGRLPLRQCPSLGVPDLPASVGQVQSQGQFRALHVQFVSPALGAQRLEGGGLHREGGLAGGVRVTQGGVPGIRNGPQPQHARQRQGDLQHGSFAPHAQALIHHLEVSERLRHATSPPAAHAAARP